MWITADVDLPEELITAQTSGNLVLFVGAGASVGAPSGLPLFWDLAKQLSELAAVEFDEHQAQQLDRFLGELDDNYSFDVHAHTHSLIADPASQPNSTHEALVRLAHASGGRVITTNYDNHLRVAAGTSGLEFDDVYVGPALPMGDDFTGLVHLHGSITRRPDQLIVTDRDFGRAYLADAWATRFLRQVFEKFTVLFVGYGHTDPVINYFSMGLPSGSRRFILTDKPRERSWDRLGIQPVGFPLHDYEALSRALARWAERANMGSLDHRRRIQEVIAGGVPRDPVDSDYLAESIRSPEGAGAFAENARDGKWLAWIELQPTFQANFAGGEAVEGQASRILARWFAESFMARPDAEAQIAALGTLQRLGVRLSSFMLDALSFQLAALQKHDPRLARRWGTLLGTSIRGQTAATQLDALLQSARGAAGTSPALVLAALTPRLSLEPDLLAGLLEDRDRILPHAKLAWPASEAALRPHASVLLEDVERSAAEKLLLFESALLRSYQLLDAYYIDPYYDVTAAGRTAIEPHDQDRLNQDAADVLIDGLRDAAVSVASLDETVIDRLWSHKYVLFRRVAVHVLGRAGGLTASEKIQWLLEHDLLFEYETRHEVYVAIAEQLPMADAATKTALLDAAKKGPGDSDYYSDAEHRAYAIYNLLVWLTGADPGWSEAAEARNAVQETHVRFAPRDHPDTDRWVEVGTYSEGPPIPLDEFLAVIVQGGAGAGLERLLSLDYSENRFDQPTWDGACQELSTVAASHPSAAIGLWDAATADRVADRYADIRAALTTGWARADLGADFGHIVSRVASSTDETESAHAIGRFLTEQAKKLSPPELEQRDALGELAKGLWAAQGTAFVHEPDSDMVMLGLNSWPGSIASFWLTAISLDLQNAGESWSGLAAEQRIALDDLLDGPDQCRDVVRSVLASDLYFLFRADAEYATDRLFPLFRDPDTASLAWTAFLYYPRWNDPMLAAGFLAILQSGVSAVAALAKTALRANYLSLLLSVASVADIEPDQRLQLLNGVVINADAKLAAEFVEQIGRFFHDAPMELSHAWDDWLGQRMRDRFAGIPRTATTAELEEWADLVPSLGDNIADAVSIIKAHPVAIGPQFNLYNIDDGVLVAHGAELIEYLRLRLGATSSPIDIRAQYGIRDAVEELETALGEGPVAQLREEVEARGIHPGRASS